MGHLQNQGDHKSIGGITIESVMLKKFVHQERIIYNKRKPKRFKYVTHLSSLQLLIVLNQYEFKIISFKSNVLYLCTYIYYKQISNNAEESILRIIK